MTTQALIERMAELQLIEQEHKTARAEYEREIARLQLEHARQVFVTSKPPLPGSGLAS